MKNGIASLILILAAGPALGSEAGLRAVTEGLAPQLEAAASTSARPETLGLSGENIATVLQGGSAAPGPASAVEASQAYAVSPISALEPAVAAASAPSSGIERARWQEPSRKKSRAGVVAEAVLVLVLLVSSVAGYFALYHAFAQAAGHAFDGPAPIEQPYEVVR